MNDTHTDDPYDDIPSEELAYHWFLQGFLASREGFNAEDTFQHNHPDKDLNWRDNTPTLTHDTRELLRDLFENEWNTPDEQTFEAMVNESTHSSTITDLYTDHTDL